MHIKENPDRSINENELRSNWIGLLLNVATFLITLKYSFLVLICGIVQNSSPIQVK